MTHTIADSQGCPIPSPHITLSCTHRWGRTHLERDTNEHPCPGAIRLTRPVMDGVPCMEQVLCARRFTGTCLVLNADPVPRKSVLHIYRRGSERRLRQVQLFEQENRNSTNSQSGSCPTAPPSSPPEEPEMGQRVGEQKPGEGSRNPGMSGISNLINFKKSEIIGN